MRDFLFVCFLLACFQSFSLTTLNHWTVKHTKFTHIFGFVSRRLRSVPGVFLVCGVSKHSQVFSIHARGPCSASAWCDLSPLPFGALFKLRLCPNAASASSRVPVLRFWRALWLRRLSKDTATSAYPQPKWDSVAFVLVVLSPVSWRHRVTASQPREFCSYIWICSR